MLRFAAAGNRNLLIGLALAIILPMSLPLTAAADTEVQARVCDTTGAQITITAPESDTVITTGTITLQGTTQQTSQVEIYIDNQYNNSVSVAASASDFTSELQLQPGTHTIRADANDACQIQNASDAVVVTYQPPEPATDPSPSAPPAGTITPPVADVTLPDASTDAPTSPIQRRAEPHTEPVPGLIMPLMTPLKLLDIVSKDGQLPSAATVARIFGTFAACALAVFGWPEVIRRILHLSFVASLPATKPTLFRRGQLIFRISAILALIAILKL